MDESITAIIVHARGEAAVRGALQVFTDAIGKIDGTNGAADHVVAPAASLEEVKAAVPAVRHAVIKRAVENVRKAANRQIDYPKENPDGLFGCHYCKKRFGRPGPRGMHESNVHPAEFAAAKEKLKSNRLAALDLKTGDFPCGMNGCFEHFKTKGWRERHWEKKHGKAA